MADVTGNANADLTVTANLQNSRSALSNLNKTGSGTMVLAGSNSYTGTTTVTDGSLVISNAAYAATITPNAIRVDYSNPPTVGTNNLLPGPVNASSLASYSVNGNGSTTVTLTNSPNLKAIVTSSAPANQKPVINAGQTFSVAENSAAGTAVGTLTATDADSNPLSGWAIVSGNTGGAFALNSSTGQLTVLGSLNYEGTPSYSLAVTVSDGTATSDPVNITVNVSNVPEYSDIFGSADPSADSNGDGISNLLAYALGATNSNSVVERPTLSVTTSNLTLTALVRTNDPKVAVWGNATTTLTNWPTNLIVGLPSADQTGAVSGITQKQDFTVERGTNARQFLRQRPAVPPPEGHLYSVSGRAACFFWPAWAFSAGLGLSLSFPSRSPMVAKLFPAGGVA
ncbi:MAG: hypothetical protein EBV34_20665 [Betaproteobacteria bacterium]|nr:hypothetical protein [Betaproteobacteria bacterium]